MTDIPQTSFPLTSVDALPNVAVAFPGEHWSDRRADGEITPGSAVVPENSGGKLVMRVADDNDEITQLAIALRTVQVPDPNTGPNALGPNQIVNQPIPDQEYVHAYYSGAFHLTLIAADSYEPSDLIGWDADATRPASKRGTSGNEVGAWAKNSDADIESVFEVIEFRPVGDEGFGILTVRSPRGQF